MDPYNYNKLCTVITIFITLFSALVRTNTNRQGRLIGGTNSYPGEFPWIVSLQFNKCGNGHGTYKHFCGSGSILDSKHVVTAAHCVWNKKPEMVRILAGVFSLTKEEPNQQKVDVEEIILHPNYTTGNKAGANDIAILKLRFTLNLTQYVQPIQIVPSGSLDDTVNCSAAGWGNQLPISKLFYIGSETLSKVSTSIIPKIRCQLAYPFLQQELTTTICATSGFFKGTCVGDSGSSLVCHGSNGTPYLVGIVAWGWFICGDGLHPDVYTDIKILKDFWNKTYTSQQ